MRYFKALQRSLTKENHTWDNNKEETELINNKLLILIASLMLLIAFTMTSLSFMIESISYIRTSYSILLILSITLLLLAFTKNKIPSLFLLYLTHLVLMIFALYTACIVSPDRRSTLVLGFVFMFALGIFDKSIRINLTMFSFLVFYIIFAVPFKDPEIVLMDTANVIGFSLVALVLSGYLRQLQIDNIDLRRQSKIRESTDSLTGLYNRAKLLEITSNEKTLQNIAAVIMIDIDYFKNYNDTYGHIKGDECLKTISDIFINFVRKYKLHFYRYGGEEFLSFVFTNEKEDILKICKNIKKEIESENILNEESPFKKVTVSIGYTIYHKQQTETFSSLIQKADKAMYISKQSGKNKITKI